ncbi:MAG: ABC transporter ATP-binding protein [Bacteriovoracaceae bacterium]|nr:ABC transporter ATP-binding protein [Bacteriovoracaceae bacterium]
MFSLLLKQFIDYKFYYLGAFFCLYGTHEIGSRLPLLAKDLADNMLKNDFQENFSIFFYLAIGIIFFRTSSRLLFFYPARIMQKNLRVELIERLEGVSPSRYNDTSSGQLFQTLQNDMEQLRALVGFALLQVGNVIIALSVFIPKLYNFHSELLIALTPMLGAFLLFTFIVGQSRGLYKRTQDAGGEVQNFLMETYKGKKTIKNFNSEGAFIDQFSKRSYEELYTFYLAGKKIAVSMPMNHLGFGISIIYGAYIIRSNDLGASSLIYFFGFIFLFMEPLMYVSWIGVVFARSSASWKRIRDLVGKLEKKSENESLLLTLNGEIGDSNLNLNINFWNDQIKLNIIEKSSSVLIGSTASGKSYVLTQAAEILKMHNKNISYVAQDPYLYNDTISKNIFLGKEVSAEDKIYASELLSIFGLDVLSTSSEHLLDLEVGENGKRVSGGQAKRIALVKSILSGADILIWDDPFSSVDIILEKRIIQELIDKNIFKQKTILLCSHRLTTVRFCDHVIFLKKYDGIIEQGERKLILTNGTKTYEHFQDQMV